MDRITLNDKEKEFMSKYAAPSVSTGRFVACVINSDVDTIREAFTDPGPILVHNMQGLYADQVYIGYTRINEIREEKDQIIVILDREVNENA